MIDWKNNKFVIRLIVILATTMAMLYIVMPQYKLYFDMENLYLLQKYQDNDIMDIGQVINYKSPGGNDNNVALYDGVDGNYIKIQITENTKDNLGYFTYINKQDILYKSIYSLSAFTLFIILGGIVIVIATGNLIISLNKKEG